MGDTFTHRVVYVDKEIAEAKRCEDCGATPVIGWVDVSITRRPDGYRRFVAGSFTCPNGPHEATVGDYKRAADEMLQRIADDAAARIEAYAPKLRRWGRG